MGASIGLFGLESDEPLLFIEEKTKWLPPSTTTHAYADEKKKQEILTLKDSSADDVDTDVIDAESGQKIGGIGMSAENVCRNFQGCVDHHRCR